MSELIPSYFHINIPFYIMLILAIIAGVYTFYYYKKTVPPVSNRLKIFLGLLRSISTFLILSLFFSPQLKLVWQNESKPQIVMAVDKSASMNITEDNQQRFAKATSISNFIQDEIKNTNEVHTYFFDIDTTSINDSITINPLSLKLPLVGLLSATLMLISFIFLSLSRDNSPVTSSALSNTVFKLFQLSLDLF